MSVDAREWWTLLDCEGELLLMAGFHFCNRLNFVRCRNRWGGNWDDHPNYLLD